jgi:hypothetical protein
MNQLEWNARYALWNGRIAIAANYTSDYKDQCASKSSSGAESALPSSTPAPAWSPTIKMSASASCEAAYKEIAPPLPGATDAVTGRDRVDELGTARAPKIWDGVSGRQDEAWPGSGAR